MIQLDYPNLLHTIKDYLVPNREESASFLIWYLENYYRLDPLEAVDSVCDRRGDKGIDGIYINENEGTIDIFQSKISQKRTSTIGDTALKEFYGSISQFRSKETVENLIHSAENSEVAKLIVRLNLVSKLDEYDIRGFFISNIEIDKNGEDFLKSNPKITFIGKNKLLSTYISSSRDQLVSGVMKFDISGFDTSEYIVDTDTKAIIAPLKAIELVKLSGISDQSLFAFNVRGSLGRTQVNKDIVKSIRDKSKHKQFPLFHNGITIITEHLVSHDNDIEIESYYVVNGCQSLTSLYNNRSYLTEDLRILTKFIQLNVKSELSEIITKYSNNQNGVKPRDFKSNNRLQIKLQNEIRDIYGKDYFYEIKRGESSSELTVISNEKCGLNLMAFDLKEPWATHRSYQVFEDKYGAIFARPDVTAHKIVGVQILSELVLSNADNITNKLFGKYLLTKYLMLYILRLILETDGEGLEFTRQPEKFIRDPKKRDHFKQCVNKIISDILVDINAEVGEYGEDFDYRTYLRDADWVKKFSREIVSSYTKLVNRKRISRFSDDWNAFYVP